MSQTGNWFFALLRFALWGKADGLPESLDEQTIKQFLAEANEQTVIGLMADAINSCGVQFPPTLIPRLVGTTLKAEFANNQINKELAEFAKLEIPDYAVVKGQTIAALYPNPSLRKPGDIDFVVRDYSAARQVLAEKWQIQLPERLIEKELAFVHNNIDYEIHDSLVAFGSGRHQRFWDQLMRQPFVPVQVADSQIYTLEPTRNAAYLFIHIFFHFLREGIGLRQLCDWAIYLHHFRDQINKDELSDILDHLGLSKAFRAFGAILVDYLGLTTFPFPISSKDRRWAEKVLPDILHGGNFGRNIKKSTSSDLAAKFETFRRTLHDLCRYIGLAPTEVILLIPRRLQINISLALARKS